MPIQNDLTHLGKVVSKDNPLPTVSGNFISKFRESFEDYPNPFVWEEKRTNATDDIVIADGNCVGASYLVISKDPWSADSEITITSKQKFSLPLDLTVGLHASQRVFGQEMVVEVVDEELVPNFPVSLNITSFVHSTTAITITTQTAHNLAVGSRVQISGVPDSRFNYPALVVSAILTPNQVSLVGASGYTIPSINQTYNFSSAPYPQLGSRSALGGSQNGTSMILENATATNAAFFIRSEAGDVLPSGVVLGNHSVTTLSTASVQAAGNILGAYSFVPTTQYNLLIMGDRLQWTNSTIDAVTAASLLVNRTQVIPSLLKDYSLRFRVTNAKDITRPVAKITSIVKNGSTTATVTCDRPHGLNALSRVTIYGVSDQAAASFPNLTTATDITAVTTNTFNVVIGTAATISSFGGIVSVVHGNNLPSSLGYNPADQVSAALATSSVDSRKRVTLISAANWTLLSIGDYVNLAGFRSSTADLGIDGVYKVENISTTSLVLLPLTSAFEASLPADFLTTNCGGQVIKRTDLRISYARFFDFARQRVEFVQRTGADAINALPVVLAANPTVTLTSTAVAGTVAVDAAIGNPVTVGLRASNANITAMSATGDSVGWLGTMIGAGIVKNFSLPETDWQTPSIAGGLVNTAVPLVVKEAAGAGIRNYVTGIDLYAEAGTATDLRIREPDLTCSSQTINANTLTTSATHNLSVGDAVVFTASTVTGITASTVTYFVLTTGANTLTLSATRGGGVLSISGANVTATFNKILWQTRLPTTATAHRHIAFPTPLRGSVNTSVQLQTVTSSTGGVWVNFQGYVAP